MNTMNKGLQAVLVLGIIILFIISAVTGIIFVFIFLFFFLIGVLLFIGGINWIRIIRLIENTPTSKVRAIAMGQVELIGKVALARTPLKSPITHKPCVFYRYEIEGYSRSGKNKTWHIIVQSEKSVPFYLEDETGRVLVNPDGAIFECETIKSGLLKDKVAIANRFEGEIKIGSNEMLAALKEKNLYVDDIKNNYRSFRVKEFSAQMSDTLYVLGTADHNSDIAAGSSLRNEDRIMIQKNKRNLYYIGFTSQKDIISRSRGKLAVCFGLGIPMILVTVYAALRFFKLL